jgi:hypothetical protein
MKALVEFGQSQAQFLISADPAPRFLELLRIAMSSGGAHLVAIDGIMPTDPHKWGWGGDKCDPHARGVKLGWIDGPNVYPHPEVSLQVAIRTARGIPRSLFALILRRIERLRLLVPEPP